MALLEDGNYVGKIVDYGVKRTAKGDAAPTIAFTVKDSSGAEHKVFWQGSWNGDGMKHAMKALLICGLSSTQALGRLAEGKSSNVLDVNAEYNLVIETEVNQNDPSKKYNRVKWINSAGIKDAITPQDFAPEIKQRKLIDALVQVAKDNGFKLGTTTTRTYQPATPPAQEIQPNDIPF